MIFLPIVDRELRVAARKHSTFWVRVVAAAVALIIGSGCMLILNAIPGQAMGMAAPGRILFGVLTWFALVGVLSAGLFFTSDCVSEEKREGTLGFLFLTDLRGLDVAAGKLLANSLRSFYALLALFPVLGLTLLMGGVTGEQFCLTCLALANALLYSLVVGLAVSTLGWDSQKVLASTLLLLLVLVLGGPVMDSIIASVSRSAFAPFWSLSSPGFVFISAGAGNSPYWTSFVITQATVFGLFAAVCILISRTWQVRGRKGLTETKRWTYTLKYGSSQRRLAVRRKLLSKNPMFWLAARERWQVLGIWVITLGLIAGAVCIAGQPRNSAVGWSYVGKLVMVLLYLWAASQASRFFSEARRTGLVELLLVSPLSERRIINGQWSALLKMFGIPILLILALDTLGTYYSQSIWRQMAGQSGKQIPLLAIAISGLVSSVITVIGNLIALCWVGMWMGLTSKSANLATLKTILFVQIVPWFVVSFSATMALPLMMIPMMAKKNVSGPPWIFTLWPYITILISGVLYLVKNIGFILWARKRLYYSFRSEASRSSKVILIQRAPPRLPSGVPPLLASAPR